MTDLQQHIKILFDLPSKEVEAISLLFKSSSLKKGELFTKVGGNNVGLSFIQSGFIRIYDFVNGKDVTQWISSEGEFITDLKNLVFSQPARRNIEAITDCELFTISFDDYQKLGSEIPAWDKLEKLFVTKCFMTLEDRVFSFLSMSAEERYNQLFNYNSKIFNQVPLHFLASMLGMTPETLSRIRKKSIS